MIIPISKAQNDKSYQLLLATRRVSRQIGAQDAETGIKNDFTRRGRGHYHDGHRDGDQGIRLQGCDRLIRRRGG